MNIKLAIYYLVIVLFYNNTVNGQGTENKYVFGICGGWGHTVAQRGPMGKTEVSDVKFVKPLTKTYGLNFDLNVLPKFKIGLEFMLDEFDYGYDAKRYLHKDGVGVVSGLMGADAYINLYKAGVRLGYGAFNTRKFQINAFVIPSVGYYSELQTLNDTGQYNIHWREQGSKSEIYYIKYPPYQKQGLCFLLKTTVEANYRFGKHFGASLDVSYQQGFTPFIKDTVNIVRPYDPGGLKQHTYWTSVNGTSLQFHIGLKYEW